MASIHPLPGPDAPNPAFPTISFLTNSSVGPALAGTPARAAPVGAPPAAAAPAAAPSSESGLAAALREAGIADGRVPGVYKDEAGGHGACPWRSGIRREGFEHVKSGRHASRAEASLRVLLLLQAHPPYKDYYRETTVKRPRKRSPSSACSSACRRSLQASRHRTRPSSMPR